MLFSINASTQVAVAGLRSPLPARSAVLGRPVISHNARRHIAIAQRSVVRAAVKEETKPEVAQFADSIGLPTDEGLFGFKPFPEVWVGRLAMMGFLTSLVEDFITGRGTLQQIGFDTPSNTLLATLLLLSGGAVLVGSASTLYKAVKGKMSPTDAARYRSFLGINKEAEANAVAQQMKAKGDFLSPTDFNAIESARQEGTPADKVLNIDDRSTADATAEDLKAQPSILNIDSRAESNQAASALKERGSTPVGTSQSLAAKEDIIEQGLFTSADFAYARQVELTNGRWAMLGFLAATLIEAGTGKGIVLQIVWWLKFVGLLGPESGFY